MKNKNLYIMSGIPGSGKSGWIEHRIIQSDESWALISRDKIRFALLKEGEDYFSHEEEVKKIFYEAIQYHIDNEFEHIYVDATHLTPAARSNLLRQFDKKDYNIIAVDVQATIGQCLERNAQREGRAVVPEEVIYRMYGQRKAPTFNERYIDEIITVVSRDNFDYLEFRTSRKG